MSLGIKRFAREKSSFQDSLSKTRKIAKIRADHGRQHKDVGVFVPEGLYEGSQAIHCLEHVQLRIRPVGHGLIPTPVD